MKKDDGPKGFHGRSQLLRWRLMFWSYNNKMKILFGCCIFLAMSCMTSRISLIMGWHNEDFKSEIPSSRQRFTVLINTWRRHALLKKSVNHYSSCRNVDAIRVVWGEAELPSDNLLFSLRQYVHANSQKASYNIEFHIDIHEEDNLNIRFKPLEGLRTDGIFSIDDDVVVSCETLNFAFTIWTSASDSMVGFVPRMHWLDSKKHDLKFSHYTYGGWWSVWWTGTYSMVLTKAAFFHRKYLELYTYHMPASIREYVTNQRNCEDLAMSFLVANMTGAPPIWVQGKLYEIGSTGISSLKGHSIHRTHCLNNFMNMYGFMPLVASNFKAVNALTQWFW